MFKYQYNKKVYANGLVWILVLVLIVAMIDQTSAAANRSFFEHIVYINEVSMLIMGITRCLNNIVVRIVHLQVIFGHVTDFRHIVEYNTNS
jgi:uncharacterized protein YebE (UPF0316 family)